MTVKELKSWIDSLPDEMEVKITEWGNWGKGIDDTHLDIMTTEVIQVKGKDTLCIAS